MPDNNQNGNDKKPKVVKIDLNEQAQRSTHEESRNFSRGSEKAKNSASSSEQGYISKPKISSEDTTNDKKK